VGAYPAFSRESSSISGGLENEIENEMFNLRMRATADGRHLGGAERLVSAEEWMTAAAEMSHRAMTYAGVVDVQMTTDLIAAEMIRYCVAPTVTTVAAESVPSARGAAAELLLDAGITKQSVERAFELLERGPGPGQSVMRGGVIMDAETSCRLESDPSRGARASRMDYTPSCRRLLQDWLNEQGLTSHRVIEAIAVAGKALWAGAVGELCWSDDPDYVAGYVCTPGRGYCRFNHLKPRGAEIGGRVFFVRHGSPIDRFVERLERIPLLLTAPASFSSGENGPLAAR
jgi:6-carboxyhexanoate--CoA ligase